MILAHLQKFTTGSKFPFNFNLYGGWKLTSKKTNIQAELKNDEFFKLFKNYLKTHSTSKMVKEVWRQKGKQKMQFPFLQERRNN
ncbi:MAG: hypothetical protein CM15mV42_0890 [uncultured marine virus]|nr:MAG: hypothetical protein CM15mV42_0890 [uncultured marine virus]